MLGSLQQQDNSGIGIGAVTGRYMLKRLQLFGSKENNQVKDPKTMVTPYAFKVADELLYIPLASPMRRGVAMAIDGLVVSVLAEHAGPLFMLLLLAAVFYVSKHQDKLGLWAKRIIYAILLVGLLWSTGNVFSPDTPKTQAGKGIAALATAPALIRLANCEDMVCAREKGAMLTDLLQEQQINRPEAEAMLYEVLDELPLTDTDKALLRAELTPKLSGLLTSEPAAGKDDTAGMPPVAGSEAGDEESTKSRVVAGDIEQKDPYSVLGWLKGAMNDLGLGFGWAAFYFTVFTAWFDGQTLGKKLTGIRVISLAGKKLGFWDAFGRYGGYGAGFATGLMGFLQIFWDANRQAIQDKIAGTVVIDLLRPRYTPDGVDSGTPASANAGNGGKASADRIADKSDN
ncbi:RDD family protein [Shewanella cyperi]|uniref:RDD family protein n=2 Tax=Shewanella cyperi TaxID=2814292 RepID=A0A974XHZ8_9GAMM|nr:RDD family protein [Shewanella cyperi]